MPATGSRVAHTRTRSLRLVGLAVTLLFLFSSSAAWATPAQARDWTPQIKATRRAQIHWEDLMRAADKELRSLKKAKKQTVRKRKRIEANLERAVEKRAAAKQRLKAARAALADARRGPKAPAEANPPPDIDLALETLLSPMRLATLDTPQPAVPRPGPEAGQDAADGSRVPALVDGRSIKKLERGVKKAKRSHKISQRKAKRGNRNWRTVKAKVRSIKAAERVARSERERAERNLGSWIRAMTKYGRIRAVKKSDTRPGVNSRFAWPVTGSISQRYHAGHDGIDIVRYKGAPVRAMAFGVVTYVGWNPWDERRRAFMVVVTHAGGYETLYGHLQPRRVVRVGEEVKKGHVIGYMGNTGKSTGPHLHLELRRQRTTLDPLSFL